MYDLILSTGDSCLESANLAKHSFLFLMMLSFIIITTLSWSLDLYGGDVKLFYVEEDILI